MCAVWSGPMDSGAVLSASAAPKIERNRRAQIPKASILRRGRRKLAGEFRENIWAAPLWMEAAQGNRAIAISFRIFGVAPSGRGLFLLRQSGVYTHRAASQCKFKVKDFYGFGSRACKMLLSGQIDFGLKLDFLLDRIAGNRLVCAVVRGEVFSSNPSLWLDLQALQ
jgi:hypothetical protein